MTNTVQMLKEQLHSPNAETRSRAALSFADAGDVNTLAILLDALRTETSLFVREDITWAIVRMGRDSVPTLIELLNDDDAALRHHVAHVISKISDARAVDALISALQDENAKVVYKAAFALGQIGDASAVPALVGLIGHPYLELQTLLLDLMEQFADEALPLVRALATHEDETVRTQVTDILGVMQSPGAIDALITMLQDDAWEVRFGALMALQPVDTLQTREAIARMSDDPHPRVRGLAGMLAIS
ncbi:HEAT repeat domain-containing protein [Phototrophicus methaneseepsis]|uniref:HEAT repeat domain-containing protein n=1 Tax=Phototrophicus methaneseepsis TaxID=2710758 RepID=A0A7S8E924_9CHLR|nr:HEAT repeat domain-containing protein [Phototrophicus methaneseepsis]QPC82523.1 HEAT repeat domain-containing protein [Phototrophicus methaneseepsis]